MPSKRTVCKKSDQKPGVQVTYSDTSMLCSITVLPSTGSNFQQKLQPLMLSIHVHGHCGNSLFSKDPWLVYKHAIYVLCPQGPHELYTQLCQHLLLASGLTLPRELQRISADAPRKISGK